MLCRVSRDSVEEPGRWEMTVYVIASCPRGDGSADITPRHCKAFKPKPGQKLRWTNAALADGKVVQSGEVTADKWGLVTVPAVAVSKGRSRIAIAKP